MSDLEDDNEARPEPYSRAPVNHLNSLSWADLTEKERVAIKSGDPKYWARVLGWLSLVFWVICLMVYLYSTNYITNVSEHMGPRGWGRLVMAAYTGWIPVIFLFWRSR